MALLDFAAHTLDYLHVTDGYEDDNGDYVEGSEEWVENYCKCDIVPAGKANVITIPDGSAKNYSYTIYNLPRACRDFEYGDKIRVKLFGNEVKEFVVLGFHRYQLQCKIWV